MIVQLLEPLLDHVTLALFLTVIALALHTKLRHRTEQQRWPEGPPTVPILGNLPQLLVTKNLSMIEFMEDNRKKYGNVYTVEFGGTKRVILSGYENMRDVLINHADHTSLRTTQAMPKNHTEISNKTPGLLFAEYPHWKTMRTFALHVLREEGMGKTSIEPSILHEIDCYIDHFISPNLGRPIRASDSLMFATANIVGSMMTGSRRDYNDTQFVQWVHAFYDMVKSTVKASVSRNIPGAAYLPGDITGVKSDLKASELVIPQVTESVEKHKEDLDRNETRDFIDQILIHGLEENDKGNRDHIFTDGNAGCTMLQLYATGTDTTSTALQWALLYMCHYPHIQEKVQSEIDDKIGDRNVEYRDKLILPFTNAVILEILRLGNIAPTALPHTVLKDLEIEGKLIPAGAELTLNMASVLWDEEVFENPREFNPDRFLNGDIAFKKTRSIPFGIGRRSCLGESLAQMEMMLFFTTFMQKFTICSVPGQKLSLDGQCSLTHAPVTFDVIFQQRQP